MPRRSGRSIAKRAPASRSRPNRVLRWCRRSTPAPTRSSSTPAAGTWVERNKASDKVKVVGFDLLDQTVQLVQSGNIQATIDQAPEKQGFEAVNLIVSFVKGQPIDNLDTGVGIYTKENIGEVA